MSTSAIRSRSGDREGRRRTRLVDDEGSVLLAVVGVMILLTVVALSAYAMSSENLLRTSHERFATQALHVADAGLDKGMWRLQVQGTNALGTFNFTSEAASCTVTTTQEAPFLFTIASTAQSLKDPRVKRSCYTQVFSMSLWNFVMATNSSSPIGSGGGHFNGNGSLNGPFYIRGSLDFASGNSAFSGGPLFVKKGDIVLGGNATIGSAGQLVDVYCDGHVPAPNTANWFVSNGGTANPNVPEIQLPQLGDSSLVADRTKAIAESTDGRQGTDGTGPINNENRASAPLAGCVGSLAGSYKVIDNDNSINRSRGTPLVLSGSSPDFGEATDDFAKIGTTLYIRGTVFIDGPLEIGPIDYAGNGTLIVNGNVEINGNVLPVTSFPDVDALGIAAATPPVNQPSASGSIDMNVNGSQVTGALYAGYAFNMTAINQTLTGSILSLVVGLGHNGTVNTVPSLPTYLPPSLPGGSGSMTFPSSWHEGLP